MIEQINTRNFRDRCTDGHTHMHAWMDNLKTTVSPPNTGQGIKNKITNITKYNDDDFAANVL